MMADSGDTRNGGGAPLPPRPKRPTIIRPAQKLNTEEPDRPPPLPTRPAPPQPAARPPPPTIQRSSETHTGSGAKGIVSSNGSRASLSSKSGDMPKRKLEITVVEARPMSEIGFRGVKGSSPVSPTTPTFLGKSRIPDLKPAESTPSVPPPRPASLATAPPSKPPPPAVDRPKRPTIIRPVKVNQGEDEKPFTEPQPPARPSRPATRPSITQDKSATNPTTPSPILTRPTTFRPQPSLRSKEKGPGPPAHPPSIPTSPPAGVVSPPTLTARPNPQPRPRSRVVSDKGSDGVDPTFPQHALNISREVTPHSDKSMSSSSLAQELSPPPLRNSLFSSVSLSNNTEIPEYATINKSWTSIKRKDEKDPDEMKPPSIFPVKLRSTIPPPNNSSDASADNGAGNNTNRSLSNSNTREVKKPPPPLKPKPKPKPKPHVDRTSTSSAEDSSNNSQPSTTSTGPPTSTTTNFISSDKQPSSPPSLPTPHDSTVKSLPHTSVTDTSVPQTVKLRQKPTQSSPDARNPTPTTEPNYSQNNAPRPISSAFLARFEINSSTSDKNNSPAADKPEKDSSPDTDPPVKAKRPITIIGGPRQNRQSLKSTPTPDVGADKPKDDLDLNKAGPLLPTKRPITIIGQRSVRGLSTPSLENASSTVSPEVNDPVSPLDCKKELSDVKEIPRVPINTPSPSKQTPGRPEGSQPSQAPSPQPSGPPPSRPPTAPGRPPQRPQQPSTLRRQTPTSTSAEIPPPSSSPPQTTSASTPSQLTPTTEPPQVKQTTSSTSEPPQLSSPSKDHPQSPPLPQKSPQQKLYPELPQKQPSLDVPQHPTDLKQSPQLPQQTPAISQQPSSRKDSGPREDQNLAQTESVKRREKPSRPGAPPPRPLSQAALGAVGAPYREEPKPARPSAPKSQSKSDGAPEPPARPRPGHRLYHYMQDQPHCIALHDYTASQPDEISFMEGDTVVLVKEVDDKWMVGSVQGDQGMFPLAFVEVQVPLGRRILSGSNWQDPADIWPVSPEPPDVTLEKPDNLAGPRCRARFDFEGDEDNELALEEGDIVRLVGRVGEEWFKGELRGETGMFPAAFVEIIEDLPEEEQSSVVATSGAGSRSSRSHSRDREVVTALYNFDGEEGDLSFRAGDHIHILKQINDDWLLGELDGREGQLPASFVSDATKQPSTDSSAVSSRASGRSQNTQVEDRSASQRDKWQASPAKERERSVVKETQVGRRQTVEHQRDFKSGSNDSGRRVDSRRLDSTRVDSRRLESTRVDSRKVDKQESAPPAYVEDTEFKGPGLHFKSREDVLCVVRGMHDYADPPLGDLPFMEGDMIDVVEFIGEDWARGRLNNKEGLFPLSFVAEVEEVPPSPEPEPEKKFGRVLHDFEAQGPDDLTLKEGDVIEVEEIADTQGNWRWGRHGGQRGMFPAVFVEEMGSSVHTVV